jgi:ABC-type multidrug transport system fused ATPase/permease subunit
VSKGRTLVLIAHRLTTARADRIAAMEQGRLVEVGRHDELLQRRSRYAALWKSWAGEEEPAG